MVVRMLAISRLHADMGTQVRERLRSDTIAEYVEAIERGDTLPPIVVFECMSTPGAPKAYVLADGFHRVKAYEKTQTQSAKAEIRKGTLDDAKWFAIGANKSHGLPRTTADKRNAVLAALQHPTGAKMSDSQIAEHCGVDQKTVWKYRQEMESTKEIPKSDTRIGRDGRTIDTANIGKSRREQSQSQVSPDSGETESRKAASRQATTPHERIVLEVRASDDPEYRLPIGLKPGRYHPLRVFAEAFEVAASGRAVTVDGELCEIVAGAEIVAAVRESGDHRNRQCGEALDAYILEVFGDGDADEHATKAPEEKPKAKGKRAAAVGLRVARQALELLQQIPQDDPERGDAVALVDSWLRGPKQ